MKRQFVDPMLTLLPLVILTVSLHVGSSSSSSLSPSSSSLSSNDNSCGKAGQLVNYTQVYSAHGGFCSDSGPSCCHGHELLVKPGIELLFGKSTFSQLFTLTDLLKDIKVFLKGLDCSFTDEENRHRGDVVKSLTILEEVDWANLISRTILSRDGCPLALTKLAFCSPNYCVINQSNIIGEGRFCRTDCNAAISFCVIEPFETISSPWKRAVGTIITSLRLLSAHSTGCQEKKFQFDTFVNKLSMDWRDPISRTNSYCVSGHKECSLSQLGTFNNGPWDKSIFTTHSHLLKTVPNSLEKYWQISSPEDTLQSSGSGGWPENEDANLHTDDEDFLGPFESDGSGSGQSPGPFDHNSNHPTTFSTDTPTNNNVNTNTNNRPSSTGVGSRTCQAPAVYITLYTSLILCFSRRFWIM